METRISGRHLDITPAIKEYASTKVAKLPRYFDRVQLIDIIAGKQERHGFEVEIIVQAEGHDRFVGKVKHDDLYACIDGAVDKLERQLTDHKEKVRKRMGKTSMSG